MNINKIFVIIFLLVIISGCSNNNQSTKPVDDKFYCETGRDCVDGEYCEVTNPGGCVNADWWWKNVGNTHDCEPNPNACLCENSKCVKK